MYILIVYGADQRDDLDIIKSNINRLIEEGSFNSEIRVEHKEVSEIDPSFENLTVKKVNHGTKNNST